MIRVEFQARGSPHAHTILWIKGAPKIGINTDKEVAGFVDCYQSCAIPEDDGELRELVTSLQTHTHSRTCKRGQSCRFRFPHPPSRTTVIAKAPAEEDPVVAARKISENQELLRKVKQELESPECSRDITLPDLLQRAQVDQQQYDEAVKMAKTGKQIILKREPREAWVNQYNPDILRTWRANVDLQFILASCTSRATC